MDQKSLVCCAPAYVEHVGLAADLTVFDVALMASCGFIDKGLVPFAAARTLVSGLSQRARPALLQRELNKKLGRGRCRSAARR